MQELAYRRINEGPGVSAEDGAGKESHLPDKEPVLRLIHRGDCIERIVQKLQARRKRRAKLGALWRGPAQEREVDRKRARGSERELNARSREREARTRAQGSESLDALGE